VAGVTGEDQAHRIDIVPQPSPPPLVFSFASILKSGGRSDLGNTPKLICDLLPPSLLPCLLNNFKWATTEVTIRIQNCSVGWGGWVMSEARNASEIFAAAAVSEAIFELFEFVKIVAMKMIRRWSCLKVGRGS
jgi:hypothetical protein